MTFSEELVHWARSLRLSDVPGAVLERVQLHLLDGIGVTLAAVSRDAAPYAFAGAAAFGSGDVPLVGSSIRGSAAGMAFATGTLMHALDFDDTHLTGLVHSTSSVAPAALSAGMDASVSGTDFLTGLVAGHEVVARLSSAAPHGFHARGFHATSVCGTYASAVVASLAYGLDQDAAVAAMGIAGSQASGSLEFLATGSSTKKLHPGWSSAAGIVAAKLAIAGATGPTSTLEGKFGLYSLYTSGQRDLNSITRDLGRKWACEGVQHKPYPACHLIHRNLDAAAQLSDRISDAEEIAEIFVDVPSDSIPIVVEPASHKIAPRTSYEAQFSTQWSVATMLLDGVIALSSYAPERLSRPDVLALSSKVRCVTTGDNGTPAAAVPGRVRVQLRDGTTFDATSQAPDFDLDSVRDRIGAKLVANVGESRAEALTAAVMQVDTQSGLVRLFEATRAV